MAPRQSNDPQQILTYCLTECPDKWQLNQTTNQASMTFQQLAEQRITSYQLYLWSAPIDLIERYQLYLDGVRRSSDQIIDGNDVFYNCSWPRFGPLCEYSFAHPLPSPPASSLPELISDYYDQHPYDPKTLTCYEHLECKRGPSPACLDWSEICDGRIDCLDGGQDEAHCWQLEMNDCGDDEHRCANGQCIPKNFFEEGSSFADCLDGSDERRRYSYLPSECRRMEPRFDCQEVSCWGSHLSSSCNVDRQMLLAQAFLSNRPDNLSDTCWSTILCRTNFLSIYNRACPPTVGMKPAEIVIETECPQSLYVLPPTPLVFGQLHFAYSRSSLINREHHGGPDFVCLSQHFCPLFATDNGSFVWNNLTCFHIDKIGVEYRHYHAFHSWMLKYLLPTVSQLWSCASLPATDFDYCHENHQTYRCVNSSKCISQHRLLNRIKDCFYGGDEHMDTVVKFLRLDPQRDFFICISSNTSIPRRFVDDAFCDCPMIAGVCDDEYFDVQFAQTHISFQTLCYGFTDLKALLVDRKSMTD